MVDTRQLPDPGGMSVIESALARVLDERRPRFLLGDGFSWHGQGRLLSEAEAAVEDEAEAEDDVPAQVASFAGLLQRGAQRLAAARAAYRESCRQAAVQARELAAFAAQRPAALDRTDGEVGAAAAASRASRPAALTAVSEWAVDEVMTALGMSSQAAAAVLAESVTLVEKLPGTLAALEAATIGPLHARMLVEVLGPVKDEVRAGVEARLLARAASKTVSQLRESARRAVLRADADAAARRAAAAIRDRSVRAFPGRDGMGSLAATMPVPVLHACRNALRQYAQECLVPGDERTLDQRMLDCLVDLILRPGETGLPAVQAQLTVVASVDTLRGGDEPGEVDGEPVPAAMVRELAHALGLLPRPDETTTAPAEGNQDAAAAANSPAADDLDTTPGGTTAAHLAALLGLRTITGTALAHLPTIAVVEEITGQLLALTDATTIRRVATCDQPACRTGRTPCTHPPAGPGLRLPPATPGYRPSDPLDTFVRARDRRCRFPGCRAAATRCDLDHCTAWPVGATSADNLCCLCRHHHRLSHQAPGWRMRRLDDGGLEWITPGGDRITTYPPAYGSDDHPPAPPPPAPPPEPPLTLRERVLGRPWRPGDEAAPF